MSVTAAALEQLRALRKACAEVAEPPLMERAYAISTADMWSRDAGRRIAAAIRALGEPLPSFEDVRGILREPEEGKVLKPPRWWEGK